MTDTQGLSHKPIDWNGGNELCSGEVTENDDANGSEHKHKSITKMDRPIPGHVFLDMRVKESYFLKSCYWTALA
jgi:hypothetical protein